MPLPTTAKRILGLLATVSITSGCATWWQKTNTVLIRSPQTDAYSSEQAAKSSATLHLPYAILSANVYERTHGEKPTESQGADLFAQSCNKMAWPVGMQHWSRLFAFPDASLRKTLHSSNMHVEVWENRSATPELVIVFEGTVFTSRDHWKANLRWFLKFVPRYEDQYTVAADAVALAFHRFLLNSPDRYVYDPASSTLKLPDGRPVRIIATGHSLGGGLAQLFAYSLHQENKPPSGPRVNEVFAFDPSPVTGWFSAPNPPRDYNASGLRINRIFEHGEVLAYLRIFTSNIVIRRENPAIWIYRYNLENNANIISGHSMSKLACDLAAAAQE